MKVLPGLREAGGTFIVRKTKQKFCFVFPPIKGSSPKREEVDRTLDLVSSTKIALNCEKKMQKVSNNQKKSSTGSSKTNNIESFVQKDKKLAKIELLEFLP